MKLTSTIILAVAILGSGYVLARHKLFDVQFPVQVEVPQQNMAYYRINRLSGQACIDYLAQDVRHQIEKDDPKLAASEMFCWNRDAYSLYGPGQGRFYAH